MPIIEITSLEHPGVEVYARLTDRRLRLATDDADGLDGTVPDALVAVLAFVFNGIDGTGHG